VPNVTIRKIRAILTAPAGINLIVAKVETSEPGLYGLGCATFAYREKAVRCAIEEYLDPLLAGRGVADIEDLWQLMNNNAYWRNGPIANNAISGVDMALWDIKGKMANMPVYDLLGGRSRKGAAVYRHADGGSPEEVAENVQKYLEQGVRHIRVQMGGYGGSAAGASPPDGAEGGVYYDPAQYARDTARVLDHVRSKLGFGFELLHDVHERLQPIEAVRLAKELEQYRLFFLEDALSPEQGEWLRMLRSQCATPIAIGELYNNPKEWDYLVAERLIDFIRAHISQIGGLTPARKMAVFCEQFGVRTAWHGPGDVSPVGHAANVHLDLVCRNFGIQEWAGLGGALPDVFPGCPELRGGYVYANDRPGLGIDLDEGLAAKYPCSTGVTRWTQTRVRDGSLHTP
jgi:mannonate dehydratase